jgi:shikimate kinase
MPGAGKSTVGLLLAKALARDFVDTDILIQSREGKALQDILREEGYLKLREIEEQVLLSANYTNHIIATGGSAVYSEAGMAHLRQIRPVVFLDVPLEVLEQRIHNMDTRGIARPSGQDFADTFAERRPLYQRYATFTIDCRDKSQEQIVEEIIGWEAEAYADMDA